MEHSERKQSWYERIFRPRSDPDRESVQLDNLTDPQPAAPKADFAKTYGIPLETTRQAPKPPSAPLRSPPEPVPNKWYHRMFGGQKHRDRLANYERDNQAYTREKQEHVRTEQTADYFQTASRQIESSLRNAPEAPRLFPEKKGMVDLQTQFVDWGDSPNKTDKTANEAQLLMMDTFNETLDYCTAQDADAYSDPKRKDALEKISARMNSCLENYAQNERELFEARRLAGGNQPAEVYAGQNISEIDPKQVTNDAIQLSIEKRLVQRETIMAEAMKLRAFAAGSEQNNLKTDTNDKAYLASLGIADPNALTAPRDTAREEADIARRVRAERDAELNDIRDIGAASRGRAAIEAASAEKGARDRAEREREQSAREQAEREREQSERLAPYREAMAATGTLPAETAPEQEKNSFYMNAGMKLGAVASHAQTALQGEDLDIITKEMDDTVKGILPGFKQQFFGDAAPGLSAQLDKIAVATGMHPGVMTALAGISDPTERDQLVNNLTGSDWRAGIAAADTLLGKDPALDGARLGLKTAILGGELVPEGQSISYASEPERDNAQLLMEKSHSAGNASRTLKSELAAYNSRLDPADPRSLRLSALVASNDRDMLASMIAERKPGEKDMNNLMESGKFMCIRALACHVSVDLGREATWEYMQQQPCLAGFDPVLLKDVIAVGGVDNQQTMDAVTSTLQSQARIYDHDSFSNRSRDFVGRILGKEMATDTMTARNIRSLTDKNYDAFQLESASLNRALGTSATSIQTSPNLAARGIEGINGLSAKRADWDTQIKMAGKAAVGWDMEQRGAAGKPITSEMRLTQAREGLSTRLFGGSQLEGATLATGVLAVDYLADRLLDVGTTPVQRAEILQQMQTVMSKFPEPDKCDLFAMTSNTQVGDRAKGFGKEFIARAKAIADPKNPTPLNERAASLKSFINENDFNGRAVEALRRKNPSEPFADKIESATGARPGTGSGLADYLKGEYEPMLGANPVLRGSVEKQLSSAARGQFADVGIAMVMRHLQANTITNDFGEYCKVLRDKSDPAHQELYGGIHGAIAESLRQVNRDGTRLLDNNQANALSAWMVDDLLNKATAHERGPADWLRTESQKNPSLETQQVWRMREIGGRYGKDGADALHNMFTEITVAQMTEGMQPGMALSIEDYTQGGAKLDAGAKLSAEARAGNDVTIEKGEGGKFSVYLGSNMMAKLGVGMEIEFPGGEVEVDATVGANYANGIKLNFENEAQCTSFMQDMFGVVKSVDQQEKVMRTLEDGTEREFTRTTGSLIRPEPAEKSRAMFRKAQSIETIRTFGMEAGVSAEATAGVAALAKSVNPLSMTVEDSRGNTMLNTKVKEGLLDVQMGIAMQVGGSKTTEVLGDRHTIETVGMTASASFTASAQAGFQDAAEVEAKQDFTALLRKEYLGGNLIGAALIRQYMFEGGAAGAEQARQTLAGFGIQNEEMVRQIASKEGDIAVSLIAGITPEGMKNYQRALESGSRYQPDAALMSRDNYHMTGIQMKEVLDKSTLSYGGSVDVKAQLAFLKIEGGLSYQRGSAGEMTQQQNFHPFAVREHSNERMLEQQGAVLGAPAVPEAPPVPERPVRTPPVLESSRELDTSFAAQLNGGSPTNATRLAQSDPARSLGRDATS